MFGSQIQASQADEEQCNFYQQFLSATHISKTEYKGEFAFKKIKDVRYRFAKGTHKKEDERNKTDDHHQEPAFESDAWQKEFG